MIRLQVVADRVFKTAKPKWWQKAIVRVRQIITFAAEHRNRPARFVHVVQDYKAGMLIQDIEAKYGCSRNTVQRYARMAGLPVRTRGDAERRALIIALYQAKRPIAEIAARCGVSQGLVSSIASEEGINRRHFRPRT